MNITLWDSKSLLNAVENVVGFYLFVCLFQQCSEGCGSNLSSVFKAFAVYLYLSYICTTQWLIWDLDGGLLYGSDLKAIDLLFRVRFMCVHAQIRGESRSSYIILWNQMVF